MDWLDKIRDGFKGNIIEEYICDNSSIYENLPLCLVKDIINEYQDTIEKKLGPIRDFINSIITHYKNKDYTDDDITVSLEYGLYNFAQSYECASIMLKIVYSVYTTHTQRYGECGGIKIDLISYDYNKKRNIKGNEFISRLSVANIIESL